MSIESWAFTTFLWPSLMLKSYWNRHWSRVEQGIISSKSEFRKVRRRTWKQPHELRANLSFSSSWALVNGEVRRPRSTTGISIKGTGASRTPASFPLEKYFTGGSCPLVAISWTEFDINSAMAAMLSHPQLQKTTCFSRSKGGFIK